MKKIILMILAASFVVFAQDEKEDNKIGLNIVFGGGFNTMKSWENYPDYQTSSGEYDNLDDIPGAGLISMRIEYDLGQFVDFPHLCVYTGSDYPITQIGKITRYVDDDPTLANVGAYEHSHTTFLFEYGLIKKFYFDGFGIYFGGAYLHESLSLDKESDGYSETYKLYSRNFKGLFGINYMIDKAWFFDLQLSYTAAGALMNEDGEKVFTTADSENIFPNFPIDDVEKNEYLVPGGLSVKIGLGVRL
ncbi:MAG: hypothetical protein RBS89_10490 [Candidatus Delongbacteria bacterium]|jgi:hypothetical protein|nr:hypothetical protein [Candidatus Delongbacteria bacterium]